MSFGTSYFDHDIFSNSFLSVLKEQVKNKDLKTKFSPKAAFKFGNEFEDSLQYEVPTSNLLIPEMVRKVKANSFYQSIAGHPNVKLQHEYYCKFYGLNFKCKTDVIIPRQIVLDIKSTGATTFEGFLSSIMRFDYDRQIYVYMTMTKCDNGSFVACSKQKNPQVFVVSVKKGDYIWQSGKRKTEELIGVLKGLI